MRYAYDALNRLTQYKQGAINGSKDDVKGHWTLDGHTTRRATIVFPELGLGCYEANCLHEGKK